MSFSFSVSPPQSSLYHLRRLFPNTPNNRYCFSTVFLLPMFPKYPKHYSIDLLLFPWRFKPKRRLARPLDLLLFPWWLKPKWSLPNLLFTTRAIMGSTVLLSSVTSYYIRTSFTSPWALHGARATTSGLQVNMLIWCRSYVFISKVITRNSPAGMESAFVKEKMEKGQSIDALRNASM